MSNGKLGPDSWPVPSDRQTVDSERHRQAMGEVGVIRRVDGMGARHQAPELLPQRGHGGV